MVAGDFDWEWVFSHWLADEDFRRAFEADPVAAGRTIGVELGPAELAVLRRSGVGRRGRRCGVDRRCA